MYLPRASRRSSVTQGRWMMPMGWSDQNVLPWDIPPPPETSCPAPCRRIRSRWIHTAPPPRGTSARWRTSCRQRTPWTTRNAPPRSRCPARTPPPPAAQVRRRQVAHLARRRIRLGNHGNQPGIRVLRMRMPEAELAPLRVPLGRPAARLRQRQNIRPAHRPLVLFRPAQRSAIGFHIAITTGESTRLSVAPTIGGSPFPCAWKFASLMNAADAGADHVRMLPPREHGIHRLARAQRNRLDHDRLARGALVRRRVEHGGSRINPRPLLRTVDQRNLQSLGGGRGAQCHHRRRTRRGTWLARNGAPANKTSAQDQPTHSGDKENSVTHVNPFLTKELHVGIHHSGFGEKQNCSRIPTGGQNVAEEHGCTRIIP